MTDDIETRRARIDAHQYLDPLWQFGLMPRNTVYEMLAKEMGLTMKQCHIKLMTKEQALSVREHAAAIRKKWNRGSQHARTETTD